MAKNLLVLLIVLACGLSVAVPRAFVWSRDNASASPDDGELRVDFSAPAMVTLPAKFTGASFPANKPTTFRVAETDGHRTLNNVSGSGGDVLYYKTAEPLASVEESYSFMYSGPESVVEPFIVSATPKHRDGLEGFATDITASRPGNTSAGNVSYRGADDGGVAHSVDLGRLRTIPYFYRTGHAYRVDAVADSTTKLLTTRVYDVALGAQAFDVHIKQLRTKLAAYPGIIVPLGKAAIIDFAFGANGSLPVRPQPARRAEDYLNYLGYNAAVSGPAESPFSLALQRYFPQLLIRHVRVPSESRYLPSLNALARWGIDADVLTGSKTTSEGLRAFVASLALPPDSIELWNEPNYSFTGGQHAPEFVTELPSFASRVAQMYPGVKIWGPSVLPDIKGLPSDAAKLAPLASSITAWNAHSYTLGAPENLGYGAFVTNACGISRQEDCGWYGSASYNDNLSAVIDPNLAGVTTEGAASYGSYPDICGHTNVDGPTQQAYVERGMLYNFKLGHLRIFPYKFIDDGGCSDGFGTYGIMSRLVDARGRPSIVPKPAYVSLVYLDRMLADAGATAKTFEPQPLAYDLRGASPDVEDLLLAESDGSYRLILWSDEALWDFNANGPHAAGSELPVVARHVDVHFGTPMNAEAFVQAPGAGTWSQSARVRSTSIGVTVNQYPLVIAIAPQGGRDRDVRLPAGVPTPGAVETAVAK